MIRSVCTPSVIAIVLLACGARLGYAADSATPKPSDKKDGASAESSALTVEDLHRMRADSWKTPPPTGA